MKIAAPSKYVVVADSICDAPGFPQHMKQFYYISYPGNYVHEFHTRHFSKASVNFADGSVGLLNEDDILGLDDGWADSSVFSEP